MKPVIECQHISKKYLISHQTSSRYSTLRESLIYHSKRPFRWAAKAVTNPAAGPEEFWALKDISLEVKRGDKVGIIGRNGAGKSTLLKIFSRITEPTEGQAILRGRVSSLLEVGTGFHPELTGRENIFLNGSILGMGRKEILRKFDEIVAFSEIEKFLDTPVKRYSSGMHMRLAFSVAAHLEPEVLIVDEVLAVGDISFQKKCLGKMKEVGAEGRTVLFVSHNLEAVTGLCERGIVLDRGGVLFEGDVSNAVASYTKSTLVPETQESVEQEAKEGTVRFLGGNLLNAQNEAVATAAIGEAFFVEMKFAVGKNVEGIPVPNFHFKTVDGIQAFILNATGMTVLKPGIYSSVCKIPGDLMNNGMYTIGLAITEYMKTGFKGHFFKENYLTLTILESILDNPLRYGYGGIIPGVVRPKVDWELKKLAS